MGINRRNMGCYVNDKGLEQYGICEYKSEQFLVFGDAHRDLW